MRTEEVFKEVLKSTDLQTIFKIPLKDIKDASFHENSKNPVIEIIKEILKGQLKHSSRDQIFQIIQKQIIKL